MNGQPRILLKTIGAFTRPIVTKRLDDGPKRCIQTRWSAFLSSGSLTRLWTGRCWPCHIHATRGGAERSVTATCPFPLP